MNLTDLLQGKKVNYMTDAKVMVELEIKTATEESHSRDIAPATRENDWWPPSEDWTTITVEFTNGFKKTFRSLSEIELVKEKKVIPTPPPPPAPPELRVLREGQEPPKPPSLKNQ